MFVEYGRSPSVVFCKQGRVMYLCGPRVWQLPAVVGGSHPPPVDGMRRGDSRVLVGNVAGIRLAGQVSVEVLRIECQPLGHM